MQNKPNLFIIGASKCGTTSLWNMLNTHPEVFMSTPKEPVFFSFSNFYERLVEYEKLFAKVSNEKVIGEASPIYSETTLIPQIPERIYNFNPNAKIIYIVRDPIERLKSVWRQTLHTGHWHKQVYKNSCDVEVPLMPKKFIKAVYNYPPYLEATKYWTHLNNYKEYFEDKNILLLFFEDLKNNPKSVYSSICSFLNIQEKLDETIFEKKNSSRGKKIERSWVVKLRQNKSIFKLYKGFSKILKLDLKLQKELKYEIDLTSKEREKIYKKLEDETIKILQYGNKDIKFWKF